MAQVTTATLGHLVDLLPSWDRSLRAPTRRLAPARATPRRPAASTPSSKPTRCRPRWPSCAASTSSISWRIWCRPTSRPRRPTATAALAVSPMAKMHPPKVPEVPVPVLSEDDLRRLLAT